MAEAATIARPYAKAAFMSARDAKALPAWSAALGAGSAMAADPRVADLLSNPKMSLDQVVSMFAGLADTGAGADAGGEVDAHWQNFVRLLATNKRLDVLPDITAQYEMLRAQYENELDVQVTSAVAMSDEQKAKLNSALKTRFKRDVRMTTSIDPALLGGAVIRAGDLVIDGSINGRLQRMATELGS
jgi:F-type H+-transporting ATPase subunit delta